MIKLLNRKPRARKCALATIVLGWDAEAGIFITRQMPKADATLLHKQGKLQMLDLGKGYGIDFGPRRSWRQMLNNEWPPHHPDVLALIAKHENATQSTDGDSK